MGLGLDSRADLLFTAGELAGFVASAQQLAIGQKNAEALLSGSIALFEQMGSLHRTAEGRIELALCYYRQGNFDLGRKTLVEVLDTLSLNDSELRCLALVRLGSLERHAGKLKDSLGRLSETNIVESSGPWVSGRHHLELASTYKDLAIAEGKQSLFDRSLEHSHEAIHQFQAIGNLRLLGIAENNLGFMLLTIGRTDIAHEHLIQARGLFEILRDRVRRAQVDDTLARLHLVQGHWDLAEQAANQAIESLLSGDEEVLLAEALTTKGLVCCKQLRFREAERTLESAYGVSMRCGDREGAGRALLTMIEEMADEITRESLDDVVSRLRSVLADLQQSAIRSRVQGALTIVNKRHGQI